MSSEERVAYKYTIPVIQSSGVYRPAYTPNHNGEVFVNQYSSDKHVLVQEGSIPHFHKDSVNVKVEHLNEVELKEHT